MMKEVKSIFLLGFFIFLLFVASKEVKAVTLSLDPSSKMVNTGDTFTVSVALDTQTEETDAADAIILYDSAKLSVTSATLGDLYTNKVIEDIATAGKITLRTTSSAIETFSGSGVLATIVFNAGADGDANVDFDFTAGSTTDCNIAKEGEDLLTTVIGATYTINYVGSSDSTPSASPSVPGVGGGGVATQTSVPTVGFLSPTILLASFGFLLLLIPLFI